jgi:preprotein translocase subunit SecG
LEGLVLFIHIVVCVLLIVVVLLQSGKSADLAGAFGGGGSQSTFGPRGTATILSKLTTTLAVLFMVTSLTLWILAANRAGSRSVVTKDDVKQAQQTGDQTGEKKPVAGTDTDKDKATEKAADTGKTEESNSSTPTETDKKENVGNPVNKEDKKSETPSDQDSDSEGSKSKDSHYN